MGALCDRIPGCALRALVLLALVTALTVAAAAQAIPPRYEHLESGLFRIHHDPPDRALAERARTVLSAAVDRYADRLPTHGIPIDVALCATRSDFARFPGALNLINVGGVAYAEGSLIVVKTPAIMPAPYDFDGVLRHELVHVLLHRNTDTAVLPRWLNEGIAMTLAEEFRWASSYRVARMYLQGRILSYRDLNLFLSVGPERAFGDAYAQSLSMTRYLMRRLDEDAFWAMVHSLEDRSFSSALDEALGHTPFELWEAWRGSLWKVALLSSILSGFTVFQVTALLVVVAYWRKRLQRRRILEAWAEEDGLSGPDWDGGDFEDDVYWDEDDDERD